MILKFHLLLLLFTILIGFVRSDICDIVKTEKTTITEKKDKIFNHCVNHEDCSHYFGLDLKVKNRTLFEKLTNSILSDFEDFYDPLIALCDSNDPDQVMEILWPLMLISRRNENMPACPINHELRIRFDGSFDCACTAGSNCDTSTEDDDFLIVLLWIIVFAVAILGISYFVSSIFKSLNLYTVGLIWSPPAGYTFPQPNQRPIQFHLPTNSIQLRPIRNNNFIQLPGRQRFNRLTNI